MKFKFKVTVHYGLAPSCDPLKMWWFISALFQLILPHDLSTLHKKQTILLLFNSICSLHNDFKNQSWEQSLLQLHRVKSGEITHWYFHYFMIGNFINVLNFLQFDLVIFVMWSSKLSLKSVKFSALLLSYYYLQ